MYAPQADTISETHELPVPTHPRDARVPPRFAYAMEDLKPSSKAPQPAVASSPHEDMPDLFFLLPLLASELPQVPLHVSNTFML